jgi:hypothetical protein
MGSISRGLRILSTAWSPQRDGLTIDLAGVPGSSYELEVVNAGAISNVEGAELDDSNAKAAKLVVRFPPGTDEYVQRSVNVHFLPRHRQK